jgi:hypothetical protein
MTDEAKTGLEGVLKYRNVAGTASVAAGTTVSYCTGFDYSWEENKKDIFNRATFAHYKPGRGIGKVTAKMMYVNQTNVDQVKKALADCTFPRQYIELQVDGVAGTGEKVIALANCGLDSHSFSQPEEDVDTMDISFTFATKPEELTYANRRIT